VTPPPQTKPDSGIRPLELLFRPLRKQGFLRQFTNHALVGLLRAIEKHNPILTMSPSEASQIPASQVLQHPLTTEASSVELLLR
jgi:hypothetical protein